MHDTMYTLGMICREVFGYDPIPQTLLDTILTQPASGLAIILKRRGRGHIKANQEMIADLVDRLPSYLTDPENGVSIEDQGPFWLGYYHYLSAKDAAKKYGPDELSAAGQSLFGERWQTDLSRELGLSDARRIRQWLAGERPIPVGVWADICGLLRHRQSSIDSVLKALTKES